MYDQVAVPLIHIILHNYTLLSIMCFYRQYEELTKKCEESKEKFSEFEQKDVRLREDLKHSKAKSKKLDKQLEQEKQKV